MQCFITALHYDSLATFNLRSFATSHKWQMKPLHFGLILCKQLSGDITRHEESVTSALDSKFDCCYVSDAYEALCELPMISK